MKLTKNIGTPDRIVRYSIAAILLFFAYLKGSYVLLAVGAFVFFEALFSWCLFYQLIGKNSCPIQKKKK